MYNVFKVPGTSLPFLQNLVLAGSVRSKLLAMAAGHVVGQSVALGPVDHRAPEMYFRETARAQLDDFLNGILSVVPVDVDAIRKYAEKWYLLRHKVAHGGCCPSATGTNGVYNVMHVGVYFTPEELGLMKFDSQRFNGFVAGFDKIYQLAAAVAQAQPDPVRLMA